MTKPVRQFLDAGPRLPDNCVEGFYRLDPQDGVVFVNEDDPYGDELPILASKHEFRDERGAHEDYFEPQGS